MKSRERVLSLLILLCLLFSTTTVFPTLADGALDSGETRYTQKIVSVVYDNSGSMISGGNVIREKSARYSLEILMSLLDAKDKMFVMPMNDGRNGNVSSSMDSGIEVDLSASDRNKEIDRVMNDKRLNVYSTACITPPEAMGLAIEYLKGNGMSQGSSETEGKEYWMIILTDGQFTDFKNYSKQTEKIEHFIKDHPTLHTIYASFDHGAVDLTQNHDLDKYHFTPYHANVTELASVIQKISNQMAGRYPLNTSQYSLNGKTLTVNLENIPFSISSLSIIAQNCGATVKNAEYNKNGISTNKPCVIKPDSILGLHPGYACEVEGSPYFMGGTVTFEFSDFSNPNVKKEDISIFVEPALSITYTLEGMKNGSWKAMTAQEINDTLGKGEKIRVRYRITDPVKNREVDLGKIFGNVTAKALYSQKNYKFTNGVSEAIDLVVGANELSIEVSVMEGAFVLRAAETLVVDEVPGAFRVEASGGTEFPDNKTEATVEFTVFVNNAPANASVLKDYKITVTAESSLDYPVKLDYSMASNGKITAIIKAEQNRFDSYSVKCTAEAPSTMGGITKEKTHTVTYSPDSLEINFKKDTPTRLEVTQYNLGQNTSGLTFILTANGSELPFPFESAVTSYKVTLDGADITDKVQVNGNELTFLPTEEMLKGVQSSLVSPGTKILTVATVSKNPDLVCEKKAEFEIIKTNYGIQVHPSSVKSIDRFGLDSTDAVLYFSILRDDVHLSQDELNEALKELSIKPSGAFSNFAIPMALEEATVTSVDGTAVIALKVKCSMPKYFDWHYSAFITNSDKAVTIQYKDAECTDHFTMLPSSAGQHVLRIGLLVFVHILIAYFITYIVGFFIVKPLPTGVFIVIRASGSSNITPVNMTLWKKYGWHLFRLIIPWRVLSSQSLKGQQPNCAGLKLRNDNGRIKGKVERANSIYLTTARDGLQSGVLMQMHSLLQNGNLNVNVRNLGRHAATRNIPGGSYFTIAGPPQPQGASIDLNSSNYYAQYKPARAGGEFNYAVRFMKLTGKRKRKGRR